MAKGCAGRAPRLRAPERCRAGTTARAVQRFAAPLIADVFLVSCPANRARIGDAQTDKHLRSNDQYVSTVCRRKDELHPELDKAAKLLKQGLT
jgi:hypothetical protein